MDRTPYKLHLEARKPGGNRKYSFVSADGIVSKNSFREPELLLADEVEPEQDDDILVFQPGFGFLGILGDKAPEGETVLAAQSDRSKQLSEKNMERNSIENTETRAVNFPSEIDRKFDRILYTPREYDPVDLVNYFIAEIAELLKQDGKMYLAGRKKGGISRYKNFLGELEGKTEKLGQRNGHRIYSFSPQGQTNTGKPEIEKNFSAEIGGAEADFRAAEGLFSPGKIDPGTELLIRNVEVSENDKVLDVGCGYGAIGIFLAKLHGCKLFLNDDSSLATYYAGKNLEKNGIEKYSLETADCLDGFKNRKFDKIVANPPTHQGRDITDEIIENSFEKLESGGELYLVFQEKVGLDQKMKEVFENTEIVLNENDYLVVKSIA